MTNIQAAIGLAQMENVDWHLARRREIAGWYDRHLAPLVGLVSPAGGRALGATRIGWIGTPSCLTAA